MYVPFNGKYTAEVTDVQGRQIYSFSGSTREWHSVPSNLISSGVHLIRVQTGRNVSIVKFINAK